jgi:hypothetical protein
MRRSGEFAALDDEATNGRIEPPLRPTGIPAALFAMEHGYPDAAEVS